MMKNVLRTGVSFMLSVAAAVGVCVNLQGGDSEISILIQNVEALALPTEGGSTCPDYNYVPNKSISATEIIESVTCSTDGQLSIGSETLKGSYERGKSYPAVYEKKNCDVDAPGACCDQRQVGIKYVKMK